MYVSRPVPDTPTPVDEKHHCVDFKEIESARDLFRKKMDSENEHGFTEQVIYILIHVCMCVCMYTLTSCISNSIY